MNELIIWLTLIQTKAYPHLRVLLEDWLLFWAFQAFLIIDLNFEQDWVALMSQPYWVEVDWIWGWWKLRLIEVEVDWSWGWLKLRLIEVEVDRSWGWSKLRLIEVEVVLSLSWLKLKLIKVEVD